MSAPCRRCKPGAFVYKILVEVDTARQAQFDERYAAYLAGDFELSGNEEGLPDLEA